MIKITVQQSVGTFAENKEQARALRTRKLLPALRRGEDVELDFQGVTLATQSFVHALIAQAIRDEACDGLEHLTFSHCTDNVRSIVEVVVSYCQDDWGAGLEDIDAADDAGLATPS